MSASLVARLAREAHAKILRGMANTTDEERAAIEAAIRAALTEAARVVRAHEWTSTAAECSGECAEDIATTIEALMEPRDGGQG